MTVASRTIASGVMTSPHGSSLACLKKRYAANGILSRTRPPRRSATGRCVALPIRSRQATSIALESAERRLAAVGLGDAGDAVVRRDLDDRAQRERRVQAERAPQRRVADGD